MVKEEAVFENCALEQAKCVVGLVPVYRWWTCCQGLFEGT